MEVEALLNERLKLSLSPSLTSKDKARLKELNGIIESIPDKRMKPYFYKGFMVHHYMHPEQFIAQREARCLRATSKEEIEKLIDKEKRR